MRDTTGAGGLLAVAAGRGVDLTVRRLDLTDRDGARRCLDEVPTEFGRIEILVNNAGRGIAGTLEQLDEAALQEQLDVNFFGPAALTRHVLPSMRKAGSGRIVSVTSLEGVVGCGDDPVARERLCRARVLTRRSPSPQIGAGLRPPPFRAIMLRHPAQGRMKR
jgi:NAD(P)-dependent dehydrogenase (short-subunit alcohol dehydrogenase family)